MHVYFTYYKELKKISFFQIINYSSINKFLLFYSRKIIGFFFLAVIWIDSTEMSRKWFFFQFVALVWNHILSLVNLFYSLLYNTLKINIIWAAKLIKLKYSCLLYYNLLLVYFRHHHYKLKFVYYIYNYKKKSVDCEMFICSTLEHFLIQKFVLSFCFPKNFDA